MSLLQDLLLNQFLIFTLVLSRVSGLVMTAPIFGSPAVPMQIRVLLAVAISLLVTPAYAFTPFEYPGTMLNYLVIIGGEVLVGLVLGMGVLILFTSIQVAGQIIGQLSGMALADVFDPTFDSNNPIFTQILYYVTLGVFVLTGGHRLVMAALLDTFQALPPGMGSATTPVAPVLTTLLSQSFSLGVRVAAPVMTALLLSTFILGLVSRTLPQLNILAVGFGLNSLITQAALLVSLGGVAWAFQEQLAPILQLLQQALVSSA